MFTIDHDYADVSNPQITPVRFSEPTGQAQVCADFLGLGSDYIRFVSFGLMWHGLCLYQNMNLLPKLCERLRNMKLIDSPARNRENGFSLIELLFAMGIFMVVLAAIASVFVSQRKSYDVQEQIAEMTQGSRSAIDMLSTEIRLAGYRLPDADFGMPYSTSQLQLFADLNADGDTLDPNENIIYTYGGTNLRINRNDVNTDNVDQPFAENIKEFSFTYFEGDGVTEVTSTDDNGKIRQIEIEIVVRTSKPDPDYSTNSGHRIYTLTSRITPINLGL